MVATDRTICDFLAVFEASGIKAKSAFDNTQLTSSHIRLSDFARCAQGKNLIEMDGTVFPEDIPFTCRKSFNAIKGQICEIKWSRPQTCFYGFRSFRETDLTTNASGIKSVMLKSDKFCQCEAACYSCLYK